ncbi:SPOR domain-containing protein [Salibacteraceae bacterium]|nr:SPOR domain-containing protein [Salibacteraceae bacterium]
MSQKPLSGGERDRIARMKGKKAAPKRVAVRPTAPPVEKENPPASEIPKLVSPEPTVPKAVEPLEPPKVETPKATESIPESIVKPETKAPEPEVKEPIKEIKQEEAVSATAKPSMTKTPEKEVSSPTISSEPSSSETKSSKMAEHNDEPGAHGWHDATKLVENVSKRPLVFAMLALGGLVLVLWVSNTFGPSHGHEGGEHENAAIESPEAGITGTEEAAPIESVEPEAASEAEEAAPAEMEGSSENEEGEAASSEVTGEVVNTTPDGQLPTPFWGIATAAVDDQMLALKFVKDLKAAGLDGRYMYIPDYIPSGKKMFRIFVGPFPDKPSAMAKFDDVQANTPGAYPFLVK